MLKKKYFKPYGINEAYELKTYKYVGRDYGNAQNANLGWILNFRRYWRKKRNRNQKQYAVCHTYTEWENHVKTVMNHNIVNGNDLIHWLYQQRDWAIRTMEGVKLTLVPIYVTLLTLIIQVQGECSFAAILIQFLLLAGIVIWVTLDCLFKASVEVSFYDDFIKVMEGELENNGA